MNFWFRALFVSISAISEGFEDQDTTVEYIYITLDSFRGNILQ
jgi:hypothetical protein